MLSEYLSVQDQCLLSVQHQLSLDRSVDLQRWVQQLDSTLSGISSCETALVSDYARLAVGISQELPLSEISVKDRILTNIRLSLVEPIIQQVILDVFAQSGHRFTDHYNRPINSKDAALDHHTQFYMNELLTASREARPPVKDKYSPYPGVKEILDQPETLAKVTEALNSVLTYSGSVSVIQEDRALMTSHFGQVLRETPEFRTLFSEIHAEPEEDGTTLTAQQVDQLLPFMAHHSMITTDVVRYGLALPDDTVLGEGLAIQVAKEDLSTLMQWVHSAMPGSQIMPEGKFKTEFWKYLEKIGLKPVEIAFKSGSPWLIEMCITKLRVEEVTRLAKTKDEMGLTPVDHAVQNGATEFLRRLSTHDQTRHRFRDWISETTDRYGYNVVMLAIDCQQAGVLKFLAEWDSQKISEMAGQLSTDGRSAFNIAASTGDLDCFSIVETPPISEGDPMRVKDQHGKNALHYAVDGQNAEIVRRIEENHDRWYMLNDRIGSSSNDGYTAMASAIISGQPEIVRVLADMSSSGLLTPFDMRPNGTYTNDSISLATWTGDFRMFGALFPWCLAYSDGFETASNIIRSTSYLDVYDKNFAVRLLFKAYSTQATDDDVQNELTQIFKGCESLGQRDILDQQVLFLKEVKSGLNVSTVTPVLDRPC